jgi:hypothetical protein
MFGRSLSQSPSSEDDEGRAPGNSEEGGKSSLPLLPLLTLRMNETAEAAAGIPTPGAVSSSLLSVLFSVLLLSRLLLLPPPLGVLTSSDGPVALWLGLKITVAWPFPLPRLLPKNECASSCGCVGGGRGKGISNAAT